MMRPRLDLEANTDKITDKRGVCGRKPLILRGFFLENV